MVLQCNNGVGSNPVIEKIVKDTKGLTKITIFPCNHKPIFSSFVIRVARWETTSETGTAYISAYFEFIPGLVCGGFRIDEKLIVSIMICPFVLFLLTIVVSVLRFIASDYPFDIFKLLLDSIFFLTLRSFLWKYGQNYKKNTVMFKTFTNINE
jgi:hypothetical protein